MAIETRNLRIPGILKHTEVSGVESQLSAVKVLSGEEGSIADLKAFSKDGSTILENELPQPIESCVHDILVQRALDSPEIKRYHI